MVDCEADWFSTILLEGQDVERKKKMLCALVLLLFKFALYVSPGRIVVCILLGISVNMRSNINFYFILNIIVSLNCLIMSILSQDNGII